MEVEYHKGFNIIKSGQPGPIFIAPHSTISYRGSEREDVGSENVAYLAVQKIGGSALISSIPRSGIIGIDYNRTPPSAEEVQSAINVKISDDTMDYYKTFAWTARDEQEYATKQKVYKEFWDTAAKLGKEADTPFFVFCHTLNSRLKNLPTAIDIITGKGTWIDKHKIEAIVEELNQQYDLNQYKEELKEHVAFWLLLYKNFIAKNFGSLSKARGMIREWLVADLKNVNKILQTDITIDEITFEKYRELTEKILNRVKLQITVESIFCGDYAKPVKPLLKATNGIAIEVESISYFNEVHPELVVNIINDILNKYNE